MARLARLLRHCPFGSDGRHDAVRIVPAVVEVSTVEAEPTTNGDPSTGIPRVLCGLFSHGAEGERCPRCDGVLCTCERNNVSPSWALVIAALGGGTMLATESFDRCLMWDTSALQRSKDRG